MRTKNPEHYNVLSYLHKLRSNVNKIVQDIKRMIRFIKRCGPARSVVMY